MLKKYLAKCDSQLNSVPDTIPKFLGDGSFQRAHAISLTVRPGRQVGSAATNGPEILSLLPGNVEATFHAVCLYDGMSMHKPIYDHWGRLDHFAAKRDFPFRHPFHHHLLKKNAEGRSKEQLAFGNRIVGFHADGGATG